MLTETVKVALVDQQFVWLEVQSTSQCSSCSAHASCHASPSRASASQQVASTTSALACSTLSTGASDKSQKQELVVGLTSQRSLKAGDTLQLGLQESSFLGLTFLFYVMPLVMMIAGLMVAVMLGANELLVVCATFTGLAMGLLFLGMSSKKFNFKEQYQPVILLTE